VLVVVWKLSRGDAKILHESRSSPGSRRSQMRWSGLKEVDEAEDRVVGGIVDRIVTI
jgi:hypothetical protein